MIVELIAHTKISNWAAMTSAGYTPHPLSVGVAESDELAEFAGRLCYLSWARPNPNTATNTGYVSNILNHQHYSVLEHSSATFYISDVTRSLTHELVRHRHMSFSQVSQRYVDEGDNYSLMPPGSRPLDIKLWRKAVKSGHKARKLYKKLVAGYEAMGMTRKEARQAARAVLPNSQATQIVVSGNLRAWRELVSKRNSPHADAEIRQLAQKVLVELKELAPAAFQDMS
jgi:thymidylate synthase (FAD)